MLIAARQAHVRLSHKPFIRSQQHILRQYRAIKLSHIRHNLLRQRIAQREQQRNLMGHVCKHQALLLILAMIAGPVMEAVPAIAAVLRAMVADQAIAAERRQIAPQEQRRNLMGHVWKRQALLLILAMIAVRVMEAAPAIVIAAALLRAMVADQAMADQCRQIAQREQRRNLMGLAWKVDRHRLTAMPIRVHLLSFSQVMLRRHRLMDMGLMVASAQQITHLFASNSLVKNLKKPARHCRCGFFNVLPPLGLRLRTGNAAVNGSSCQIKSSYLPQFSQLILLI